MPSVLPITALATGLVAFSTTGAIKPAVSEYSKLNSIKPDIVEISKNTLPKLDTPEDIVNAAIKNMGESWSVNINTNSNMVELKLLPPKERTFFEILSDVNNPNDYTSAHKTPAQIKALFGLQDGVLKKHNDLKSMWYNYRESLHIKTGVNDIDFVFKRGAKIKFPLDEVGKNIEACKRYIKDGVVEIIEKAADGSITKSVWSKVHL